MKYLPQRTLVCVKGPPTTCNTVNPNLDFYSKFFGKTSTRVKCCILRLCKSNVECDLHGSFLNNQVRACIMHVTESCLEIAKNCYFLGNAHYLMMSHVFWPFLTYLPTLSYSLTSHFGDYLGPLYLP